MKTVKSYLLTLKKLSEETLIGDLKGQHKLTLEEESYLRTIIAGIQNDLGEMPPEIWEKFKVKPYNERTTNRKI